MCLQYKISKLYRLGRLLFWVVLSYFSSDKRPCLIKVIFVDRPGSNSDELIIAAVEAEDDSTESRNRDQDDYVYYDENTNQLLDSYGFPLSQVKIML